MILNGIANVIAVAISSKHYSSQISVDVCTLDELFQQVMFKDNNSSKQQSQGLESEPGNKDACMPRGYTVMKRND